MDFFDASKVQPSQGVGGHPPGRFPFAITNTHVAENRNKDGGMLVVEMTSDVGRIENRYNLWNKSEKAVEIAQKELSALCHATGIFRLTFPKDAQGMPLADQAARELRGGRGIMEVAFQKGHEPSAEKPEGGYVEVRKVFDASGNEPGKGGAAPQVQPVQQPQQAPQQPQQPSQPAWGGAPTAQPAQQAPQQPAWAPQGNAPAASPPWGK